MTENKNDGGERSHAQKKRRLLSVLLHSDEGAEPVRAGGPWIG